MYTHTHSKSFSLFSINWKIKSSCRRFRLILHSLQIPLLYVYNTVHLKKFNLVGCIIKAHFFRSFALEKTPPCNAFAFLSFLKGKDRRAYNSLYGCMNGSLISCGMIWYDEWNWLPLTHWISKCEKVGKILKRIDEWRLNCLIFIRPSYELFTVPFIIDRWPASPTIKDKFPTVLKFERQL